MALTIYVGNHFGWQVHSNQEHNKNHPLLSAPDNVITNIFSDFGISDLKTVALVCKRFKAISGSVLNVKMEPYRLVSETQEIVCNIFSYLEISDLKRVALVGRTFRAASADAKRWNAKIESETTLQNEILELFSHFNVKKDRLNNIVSLIAARKKCSVKNENEENLKNEIFKIRPHLKDFLDKVAGSFSNEQTLKHKYIKLRMTNELLAMLLFPQEVEPIVEPIVEF